MKNRFIVLIAIILALSLLAGCGKPSQVADKEATRERSAEETADEFVFTRENFPEIDGSTPMAPFCQAVASVLLGQSRESVRELMEFSKTAEAYRSLMRGDVDIVLAAEPSEAILEEKETLGFEWDMEPVARDGIVFTVSKDNPVDSLTAEQVKKIYSGEITNWSQVGGNDIDIIPFQRYEEAGSQTAMKNCVMGGTSMIDAPSEYVSQDAGGLISAVSNFEDSPAAIGYSFYYYAKDMGMADGLKILDINGVQPNDETIKSGEYPFLSNYYVLIKEGLPKAHPAKVMFDWILSEEGRQLAIQMGYVPANDTVLKNSDNSRLSVHTEASMLTPYSEKAVYSHFEPRSLNGHLQPRDDYGELLQYTGEEQLESSQYLYGLVTTDGRLVTEPVYSWVHFEGSFMMLAAKEPVPINGEIVYRYFVGASDGSWIRELKLYHGEFLFDHDLFAIKQEDGSLVTLNGDGDVVSEFSADIFKAHFGNDFEWYKVTESVEKGVLCFSLQDDEGAGTLYLDVTTGKVLREAGEGSQWNGAAADHFQHEKAEAKLSQEQREDYFCYYSNETGETVFSYPIKTNND